MRPQILFIILIVGCSAPKTYDKNFPDLTAGEKLVLFRQFGDELKGNFLIYSGRVKFENTTGFQNLPTFIELVMDKDNRFVIRLKTIESEIKADSMTISFAGGNSNTGMGQWTDLGDKFELKFKLVTVDSFFDKEVTKTKFRRLTTTQFNLISQLTNY